MMTRSTYLDTWVMVWRQIQEELCRKQRAVKGRPGMMQTKRLPMTHVEPQLQIVGSGVVRPSMRTIFSNAAILTPIQWYGRHPGVIRITEYTNEMVIILLKLGFSVVRLMAPQSLSPLMFSQLVSLFGLLIGCFFSFSF